MSANLLSPGWAYGVGFIPGNGKKKYSQLVFKISETNAARVESLIKTRLGHFVNVKEYLGADVPFLVRNENHFGQGVLVFDDDISFGFRGCGTITSQDEEVWYQFPLRYEMVPEIALSIHVLTTVLNGLLGEKQLQEEVPVNRHHLLELHAFTRPGEACYGHPVGGNIYPALRQWIGRMAAKTGEELPPEVTTALQSTWKAIAWKSARSYTKECNGRLYKDGRFIFSCLGDACDVAIYPDGDHGIDSEHPSHFSCHNLDNAAQQLTLLAGLFALYELAAHELE